MLLIGVLIPVGSDVNGFGTFRKFKIEASVPLSRIRVFSPLSVKMRDIR